MRSKFLTPSLLLLFALNAYSQEHFSGITTSKRVGILNAGINPSELVNLKNKFEIQLFATSINVANNKIGFKDIIEGNNIESKIFEGNEPVNFNLDGEIAGPGFAMKILNWGFAVTTKAHIKANIVDVDPKLGDAVTSNNLSPLFGAAILQNSNNQRINATVWGEVGFSAARKIFENDKNQINAGITFKLLFPGSYANFGAGNFQGTITNSAGNFELSNANANINIGYSGSLSNDFNNTSDYSKSLFGNLNGLATDIGIDYQLKGKGNSYKLKVGASVRNIGSMTFKSDDNVSTNYKFEVQGNESLNLNQFENAENIKDIETILLNSGYLTQTDQNKDFKVQLPTVFNFYADLNIVPKFNVTLFLQQKLNENNANDQIVSQNSLSLTPRFDIDFFEVFMPIAINEISGTTGGLGFRLSGFFIGSNSILSAITNDSKQFDAYVGYRYGFL